MMVSCWPFITARPQILLSYLQRPEVAQLLAADDSSSSSSGDGASAAALPSQH